MGRKLRSEKGKHFGYSVVRDGKVIGDSYKVYEKAKAASSGGIVIRTEDIEKHGYTR